MEKTIVIPREAVEKIIQGYDDSQESVTFSFEGKEIYISMDISQGEDQSYFKKKKILLDIEFQEFNDSAHISMYTYMKGYHSIIREKISLKEIFEKGLYKIFKMSGPFSGDVKDLKFQVE